jgi:hypothetical protein
MIHSVDTFLTLKEVDWFGLGAIATFLGSCVSIAMSLLIYIQIKLQKKSMKEQQKELQEIRFNEKINHLRIEMNIILEYVLIRKSTIAGDIIEQSVKHYSEQAHNTQLREHIQIYLNLYRRIKEESKAIHVLNELLYRKNSLIFYKLIKHLEKSRTYLEPHYEEITLSKNFKEALRDLEGVYD